MILVNQHVCKNIEFTLESSVSLLKVGFALDVHVISFLSVVVDSVVYLVREFGKILFKMQRSTAICLYFQFEN